jgi:hypothetical protein
MKFNTSPRGKKAKAIWYVTFRPKERQGKRVQASEGLSFQTEREAKAFARAKLADGLNVSAGTLNPHQPKRTISSIQLREWLNEPSRRSITK